MNLIVKQLFTEVLIKLSIQMVSDIFVEHFVVVIGCFSVNLEGHIFYVNIKHKTDWRLEQSPF